MESERVTIWIARPCVVQAIPTTNNPHGGNVENLTKLNLDGQAKSRQVRNGNIFQLLYNSPGRTNKISSLDGRQDRTKVLYNGNVLRDYTGFYTRTKNWRL